MKRKQFAAILMCTAMTMGLLSACGSTGSGAGSASSDAKASSDAPVSGDPSGSASADSTQKSESGDTAMIVNKSTDGYDLNLADFAGNWVYKADYDCYALENVVYCEKPLVTSLQSMNIYVPSAYMNEDGSINKEASINGYTAETAPIIYKNDVAGYMEASPVSISDSEKEYMEAGFIYVSVGARGRATQLADGTYVGKSPYGLIDLKAGVRFLKHNDDVLAGSSDRIISVGTSAGGALSSLLGITGNSSNYDSYLEEAGAIMDESDEIYAAQCYCPITDLENADKAYEWEYQADSEYLGFLSPGGSLTDFQQALSKKLADEYVDYYNSLDLVDFDGKSLSLDSARSGSGYDFIKSQLEAAAGKYLTKLENGELDADYSVEDYLSGNYSYEEMDFASGKAIEKEGHVYSDFLEWDGEKATLTDFDKYVTSYNRRLKTCTAFDDLDLAQAENQEMGSETVDVVHFSDDIAPLIADLKEDFPEEYDSYYEAYATLSDNKDLEQKLYLLNPMNYLGTDEKCDTAPYFRIRVGTFDPHTAVTVSMNLALKIAQTTDADVDYATVWDQPHGEADYAGEFTSWVEDITK